MQLIKCANCTFNLLDSQDQCPNCGQMAGAGGKISRSGFFAPLASKAFLIIGLATISSIIFVLFLGLDLLFLIFVPAAFFVALVWLLYPAIRSSQSLGGGSPARRRFNAFSLLGRRKIINQRIDELKSRLSKIDSLASKVDGASEGRLAGIAEKLGFARELVSQQLCRYILDRYRIELAGLQNELMPYLFNMYRLNDFETENALAHVRHIQRESNEAADRLARSDMQFPGIEEEKKKYLAQLDDTLLYCGNLRDFFLKKQAVSALEDISAIDDNFEQLYLAEMEHSIEAFNIQTTLADFSDDFDRLELEYKRLKAEQKINSRFLRSRA